MTTVFICGDIRDGALEKLMNEQLSRSYNITYVKGGKIWQKGNGYEIAAVDFPCYIKIDTPRPLVIMKKEAVCNFDLPSEALVIACAENREQLFALKQCGAHILTCGFSPSDTLSYSSIDGEKVMVSLNREITALSGKKIQPLEIPLDIPSDADVYYLLAFTFLRLLLDDYNSEIGRLY